MKRVISCALALWMLCGAALADVVLPEDLQVIEDEAFATNQAMTGNLVIPHGVTTIGKQAFGGCKGLNGTLTIPDSVISIGYCAFAWCENLTGTLEIPSWRPPPDASPLCPCSSHTSVRAGITMSLM